jgi:uncharacterized membrane protein
MGAFELFFIRLILSIIIAFLISRFFFHQMPIIKVFGLGFILLGLAYLQNISKKVTG